MGLSLSLSICWSQKLRIIRTAFSPLDILCHVAPFTPRCYLSEPTSALPPALPFERQLSIRPLPMASSSHTIKRRRLESVCEDVGWTASSWLESADVLSRLAEVLLPRQVRDQFRQLVSRLLIRHSARDHADKLFGRLRVVQLWLFLRLPQ